ncbi:hypothetical protein [Hirschia baltica]|uniref:UrcA family protein n=1 Tax=Hirschia baltica (strain ATCC 49814 / DSM 5838 / IFAM 1418) TaxID=582402 RepID=C6XM71_HIRBI|nr:hypothetical protein [Hirschia baltica]ACT59903.1 hypothetical protein Hbal_2223 [Hirschia baltica ATCC 49814]
MNKFQNILALTAAFACFTLSAKAEVTEEIEFSYNPNISAEANYVDLRRTAKRACRDRTYFHPYKLELACRGDLLDQAIAAINAKSLSAHHQQISHGETLTIAAREQSVISKMKP